MCERLYKNRTPILTVFNNISVTKPAQAWNLEMAASEWLIIDELVTLLKPLQCATTVFCSSSEITISLVPSNTRHHRQSPGRRYFEWKSRPHIEVHIFVNLLLGASIWNHRLIRKLTYIEFSRSSSQGIDSRIMRNGENKNKRFY